MARLHFVKKARKDNPVAKAGESYYWWQFAYQGKSYSKGQPRRSQLINSPFLSQMCEIEERIENLNAENFETMDDLQSEIEDITSEVEGMRDEAQDGLDAVPEQLQETHMLYERVESVEEMVSELESLEYERESEDDIKAAIEAVIDDVQMISYCGG